MQHDILRFDIAMDNPQRMNFIHSLTHLPHEHRHLILG